MRLRYTRRAKTGLSEIYDFVAQDNRNAATRIITKIHDTLNSLLANPFMGRPGRIDGTRELIITHFPFIVVYRVQDKDIHVLAIIHTARLWPDTL
ncbi:type II toxin-antitoxin system RelE/ParE family toxin [Methylomonas sp. BW4-1]|uniref:type II toxin-antitoxin system RelE/ParE family toxin n=1 Tax=unclassified Methylomonas TaxID=2608980 RepID=UPI00196827D7|nr:type II toxin-antitoxin system RelE/ParE family toxin [Methylomonas sp. EFPC1]QSB01162.1 type II toxin-antitoxin system RelE/ParE family toxin [Methylomonas sp. EFPC1]